MMSAGTTKLILFLSIKMKKILVIFLLFLSILAQSQTKNVLFIGNSYTYSNSMPQIVSDIANSMGDHLTYSASAVSSYSLAQHSTYAPTLSLIGQGGWDYVVLQEFSQNPSNPLAWVEANVYPYAQFLSNQARLYSPNAVITFYMTWGRRDGDPDRCPTIPEVCTYIGMDNLTRARYMVMAEANSAIVSPVGAVWRYIRAHYPAIELYIADGSHPSAAGSYAAACSFYTAFFKKDPTLIPYNYTLSSSDASQIRNAAKLVVYDSLSTWHIGQYDIDTQAPTAPTGLNAGNIAETSFTLSWTASTDNVGVTGYSVYRNGSLAANVTNTAANISGLTPATTYSMTVKARDAAGNISNASNTLNVTTTYTPVVVTITGLSASNKVYDGTASATLNTGGASLVGVSGGDNVNLVSTNATGTFSNKNTGTGKTVSTSGFTLSGTDSWKYTLTQPTLTANITKAPLTVSGVTANSKVYDAAVTATLNTGSAALSGVFSGDAVSLVKTGVTGNFSDKNIGTGKTVLINGFSISGTDSGNYTLTQPSPSANITAAGLTISGVTANNKVYDGTTTATLNTGSAALVGVAGGDAVNLISTGATGTFASPNIGNSIIVTVSGFVLGGTDAGNYTLTQPTTSANITGILLSVTNVTANDKIYDGTTVATLNTVSASLSGIVGGDIVTLITTGATGTFSSKNTGTSKTVTTSGFALGGADAGKYTLMQPLTSAAITRAGLTISGVIANNKAYDGTTSATLSTAGASLTGVFGSDQVNLNSTSATGTFASANIGTAITVTTSGFTLNGTDSPNYTLTQPILSANITPFGLTVSGVTASNKVYNANTDASINTAGASLVGVLGGDNVILVKDGVTGTFVTKNSGNGKTVTTSGFTLSGTDAGKYSLIQPSTTANITKADVTITGVTANNKVYNGTTSATLNSGSVSISGVFGGDIATLLTSGASGTFANKNIGMGKTVTTSGFTLTGSDAGNYNLIQPTTTANISSSGLTISGVVASNKVYDRTTSVTLNTGSATLAGVFGSDVVTLIKTGVTGSFDDKNAGTGKTVSISGFSIGGTDSGNYTLSQPTTTANITAAVLTVSGVTANNKVYNGTTSATINTGSATLTGIIGSDVVTLITTGATGSFSNKNIGTGKTVTTSGFTLGGADSGNYTLTQPATTANITGIVLSVAGVTANNKVYNGTTTATLNTGTGYLIGVVPGDAVTLVSSGATGNFENKNVGSTKVVNISGIALGGTDAGNYTVTQPSTTANITAYGLVVSGIAANNKTYNATTTATLVTGGASLVGVFGGDVVNLITTGATGFFMNKNVGTSKTISTSGFSLGGTDAANYTLTQPVTTANITAATLTITGVIANDKVYNGTTATTLNTGSASLSGIFGGDIVNLITTGATGTFANKNVGIAKAVSVSGFTIGGADAGNYVLTQPASTANITAAVLTISGVTVNNKVYNGLVSATLNTGTAALAGVLGTDAVTLNSTGASGTFINKNAGLAKSVSTSGFTIGGADAVNYTLTQPVLTANITAANLTISGVTANNKVYDGLTAATLNSGGAVLGGVLGTDAVTLISSGAMGVFSNKNAGLAKLVITSGFSLAGADAGNYQLVQPILTANISRKELTIGGTFTVNNKVYDGTTSATITTNNLTLLTKTDNDNVSLVAVAVFSSKDVGTGKTVTLNGSYLADVDAPNYTLSLSGSPTTTATITLFGLTVTGVTAYNKVYDGTTTAVPNTSGAVLVGIVGSDIVSIVTTGSTANFVNKNVGSGKLVTITNLTLTGPDAWKYTLIQPTTTAGITTAVLSVEGVRANNKVYNGTIAASLNTVNATLAGVFGADVVTLSSTNASGTYINKDVGISKAVTTSGFIIGGADASNYILTQPSLTADITRATLTISGVTANNKVYSGNTSVVLNTTGAALAGIIGTDAVNLSSAGATASFADKNAGNSKPVATSGFTISGAGATNYTLVQPVVYANILPKALTVNVNNLSKSYGTTLVFTGTEITLTGLVDGDTAPSVTLTSPGATASANAGTYVISAGGGVDNNYSFTYVNGSLIVRKSVVSVKADNKTKFYGHENPALSVTYSGFKNGEDYSVINVLPVISVSALKTSGSGVFDITLSGGSDDNYDLTLVNGSLEIVRAPLVVTAEDKAKVYRDMNPDLTLTYSGFVLGQDQSVLSALPVIQTSADENSDAGNYDITVSGGAAANYDLFYNKGTLTINKADQVINFDDLPEKIRVTQQIQLNASATSGLVLDFETSDPDIGTVNSNILKVNKDGKLTITAKQEGNQNWNPASSVSKSIVTLPTFDNISSLFTPNNDGMNDYWYIPDLEQYGKVQVTVYNRFGQVVYQSDGYKNDWDGTWNGYMLPEASYYYVIVSSTKGFIKGVVNIVR
jgi:trimeric autotransporter adhesin